MGSIVVPFWITLWDSKYEPQKGTTMEPMGTLPLATASPHKLSQSNPVWLALEQRPGLR